MFKASTVYWCNIPAEKPGSRNCGTGKVIKVESSKMQERHDEAWKNWRTARKSRSVFEILRSVVLKCFNETHAWFDLQLNFPSLCKLPRLKLYKIHIHDGSFLCDFTRFLLEIQSRTCFSSWLHPSFQQNKYTKHIQNNLWQAQTIPEQIFGAQNTTWCSKSVLAPPEPSCSNEGQQEKEKHWPGVRSPRAAGSYTVLLSSILLVFYVFSALMSMSKFHTHTCVPYSRVCLHLLRWTCKEASKFLDRLMLSIINHIIRIWSPNRICRIIQSLNRGSVLDCHWLIMSRPTCEYLPNPSRKMRNAP